MHREFCAAWRDRTRTVALSPVYRGSARSRPAAAAAAPRRGCGERSRAAARPLRRGRHATLGLAMSNNVAELATHTGLVGRETGD